MLELFFVNKKLQKVVNSARQLIVLPVWSDKSDWSVFLMKVCHQSLVSFNPSIVSQISYLEFRLLVLFIALTSRL